MVMLIAGRPVVVIEDLHWADPETLDVVEFIADHVRGRGAALVVTLRSGESSGADAVAVRIGRTGRSTTLDLAPLRPDAVDACQPSGWAARRRLRSGR